MCALDGRDIGHYPRGVPSEMVAPIDSFMVEMMGRIAKFLLLICVVAPWCTMAGRTSLPAWLEEEFRFSVEGSDDEVAEMGKTLDLMREAICPEMRSWVERNEMLGPCLQWAVRLGRSCVTNEAAYLSSSAHPDVFRADDFNRAVLTNSLARLNRLPTVVKLKLVYGTEDRIKKPVERALPGVDYPGTETEDAGSTPQDVRLVLRAPKNHRRFRVETEPVLQGTKDVEFRWLAVRGRPALERTGRAARWGCWNLYSSHARALSNGGERIAVFAREEGGFWGPPSFIDISADSLGVRKYASNGDIESIDYGAFKDMYALGDKGVIIGFSRMEPGMLRGERYSSAGELILESYSDERPKTTQKVKYSIVDGRLTYKVSPDVISHKDEPTYGKSLKW